MIKRAVLNAYGLVRLASIASPYLDECLSCDSKDPPRLSPLELRSLMAPRCGPSALPREPDSVGVTRAGHARCESRARCDTESEER